MAAKKKVSKRQLNIYVQYFEKNELLRTGKLVPNMPPNSINDLWQEIAQTLNNCGDGPTREAEKWKTTFIEWKSQVRKRARDGKDMTEVEKRFLKASGLVVVEGMENVQEMGLPVEHFGQLEPPEPMVEEFIMENIPIVIPPDIPPSNNEPQNDKVVEEKSADESVPSQKRQKGKKRAIRTSTEQYEEYLNYLQTKVNNFEALCLELNKLQGPTKSVAAWKKCFADWQYSVRRKAREIYVHRFCTGGGLPINKFLTEMEERLLEATGKLMVTGMNVIELGLVGKKFREPPQKIISTKVVKLGRTRLLKLERLIPRLKLFNFQEDVNILQTAVQVLVTAIENLLCVIIE